MAWVLVSTTDIVPGTEAVISPVTLANQVFAVDFPLIALQKYRYYGVMSWKQAQSFPGYTPVSMRAEQTIWCNPRVWSPANASASGNIFFYVPKAFGSTLRVRAYRFD